jgi:hypothetical protein
VLIERPVWAMGVVVLDELLQYYSEVAKSGDQEMVEAFAAERPYPAFRDGVGPRCLDRGAEDADVGVGEDGVEGGGDLVVPIADLEPGLGGVLAERSMSRLRACWVTQAPVG